MPKITLIIHTASSDGFLGNQGIVSYFNSLCCNLNHQSFKDFELVYVDTFYEQNKDSFSLLSFPFVVKHVGIHPNHRYWYDLGYVYISAAKNTGILYADGELLISCDDAEFFPSTFLELYWKHYCSGHLMHAFHKRMKSIYTLDGLPVFPISGDIYINDHRLSTMTSPVRYHRYGSQTFAGTSFGLSDALHINGFNERMDSCKSLEDCDFGGRLVMIGKEFAQDIDGFLYILDHQSYGDVTLNWEVVDGSDCQMTSPNSVELNNKKEILNLIAIENYGMLKCAEELIEPTANKYPITDRHLEIICRETLKYRGFNPLSEENADKFALWINTPTFSLKEEREELRKKDWKW